MEKTIQMMKESGLFDSLVQNIHEKDMPIEAVAVAIDHVCTLDENFEDTFFNDIHNLGIRIIWDGLMTAVNNLPERTEVKQDTVEDLLKKLIDLLS